MIELFLIGKGFPENVEINLAEKDIMAIEDKETGKIINDYSRNIVKRSCGTKTKM